MKISFVIPAYNEEHHLGACLGSIMRELDGERHDVEIIVVNNASTDKTREVALRFPGVRVVDEPHKGIVWARARGFQESTGELVANIDADTMLTPGWLKTVLKEFERDRTLVCLSGPMIYADLSRWQQRYVKLFYAAGLMIHFVSRLFGVGAMAQGGNFVLKKDAWLKAGGFDTAIDFYGEDTDVARRSARVGKVKWTFRLPIIASGRRLAEDGLFTTGVRYAINYLSILFRGKPFTTTHQDIRNHPLAP